MAALLWRSIRIGRQVDGQKELTKDKSEEKSLPACEIADNRLEGVRFPFRDSASFWHSFFSKFNLLNNKAVSDGFYLDIGQNSQTYSCGEYPVWLGGARSVGQEEVGENCNWERNDAVDDCGDEHINHGARQKQKSEQTYQKAISILRDQNDHRATCKFRLARIHWRLVRLILLIAKYHCAFQVHLLVSRAVSNLSLLNNIKKEASLRLLYQLPRI